jgi:uncharacterized protein (TIRG00374 family)
VVTGRESAVLVALWAAGLLVYSFVLTSALPGLSRRRALTLNLTGSAVANVVPVGGAAGISLNYVMVRAWGYTAADFSAFTLVTNVWNVLLKLALPPLALSALVVWGGHVGATMRWSGLVGAIALVLVVAALFAALARRRAAERLAHVLTPATIGGLRLLRRHTTREQVVDAVLRFRDRVAEVVGGRWLGLSVATLGYGVLQAALLWACLLAVGATPSPVVVLAGYAVDRLATMVFLTPGGSGFAEAGATATLVALGGDPALVTAGVLLYRGFTFALEIPVGGAWLAGWLWTRSRAQVPA